MKTYFFFYFIKISFPVHFIFKWRQNLSARPRTYYGPTVVVGQSALTFEISFRHTTLGRIPHVRVIGPSQRLLPDNILLSKDTEFLASEGFEPLIPASEKPQAHALDRAATGTGKRSY